MTRPFELVAAKADLLSEAVQEEITRNALDRIDDYRAKLVAVEAGEASIAAGKGVPWTEVRQRLMKRRDEIANS